MPWFFRYLNKGLFEADKGDKGAGGSAGAGSGAEGKESEGEKSGGTKSEFDALVKRLEALEGKGKEKKPDPEGDPSLADKAKKEREKSEASASETKKLESAIRFNLGAKEWLKVNESLLPKSIASILEMADKENYSNPVEKDSAIKLGLISEFFAQQANVDLLTVSQKSALDEFLKLTKTVKQERSQSIYDTLFEPTFEMLKKLEKAKQLTTGQKTESDDEDAYKKKLISGSRKHFLGEK